MSAMTKAPKILLTAAVLASLLGACRKNEPATDTTTTTAAPLSLALGLTAGVVSALYPAWVASRQRPADALRG